MRILYSIVLIIISPLIFIYGLVRSIFNRTIRKGLFQRLGFLPRTFFAQTGAVWFHAASVGELNGIAPLIALYIKSRHAVVITTLTATGCQRAAVLFPNVPASLLPIDIPFCIYPVVRRMKPALCVIAETELWPNMYHALQVIGTPKVIVNARISDSSFKRYRQVRGLFQPALLSVCAVFVQNEVSRRRFAQLGVPDKNIHSRGNIKFDVLPPATAPTERRKLFKSLGWNHGKTVWCITAGSTRPGEHEQVITAFTAVRQRFPQIRLIIAPRHTDEAAVVAALVKKAGLIPTLYRSIQSGSDVLIVDRMGVLTTLYGVADLCFIGGTLVNIGGHNPLEAALQKKVTVFGPSIKNNAAAFEALMHSGGGIMVHSAAELADTIIQVLSSNTTRRQKEKQAAAALQTHRGAARRIYAVINTLRTASERKRKGTS